MQTTPTQNAFWALLGLMLITAGTGHLSFARKEFRAQVPHWVPLDEDTTVVDSGYAEIALGLATLLAGRRKRMMGWVLAGFFTAVFPGNVAQYRNRRDGFGLDTDDKRLARLFLQPALIAWALWSTGAWQALMEKNEPEVPVRDGAAVE